MHLSRTGVRLRQIPRAAGGASRDGGQYAAAMDEPRGTGTHDARASGAAATRADCGAPAEVASRGFQILAVLLLPGAFIRYAHGNLEFNDFSVYYTAAHAVLEGLDPYSVRGPSGRPYLYPPGFAVLLAPLAALPYPAAAVLWTALGFAAVLASLWLCLDLLGVARGAAAWTLGGFTLLCSGRMLDGELGNGQANHWVLLGIAASVWLVARRRAALGGFALAFAIVAKLTPLLLVPYYAMRREWRACAGVAAGIAILAGVLPALALGPRAALDANRAWVRTVAQPGPPPPRRARPRTRSEGPARAHGYSLRAYVRRHLTFTRAEAHHDEPVFVNAVAWSARTAEAIYLGLAAAGAGRPGARARHAPTARPAPLAARSRLRGHHDGSDRAAFAQGALRGSAAALRLRRDAGARGQEPRGRGLDRAARARRSD